MKRTLALTAVLCGMVSMVSVASAQTYDVGMTYVSKYVWRGSVLAQDGALQPSFTGGMENLSVNLWANADLTDERGTELKLNEMDYTVDYSKSLGSLSLSAGIIGYTFPNLGGHTTELYLGAGYDVIGSPSIKVYQDLELFEGTYVALGGGYSLPIGELTSVDIAGTLGFGSKEMVSGLYVSNSEAGLTDVLVSVSAPFSLMENYSITPSIALSSILDADAQDAYDAADVDYTNIFFGLSFGASF